MLTSFAVIIAALIFNMLLGTILGILLTVHPSNNTRLKVAVFVFVRPVVYSVIMGLLFFSLFTEELIWALLMIAIVLIIELFFTPNRFLAKITIEGDTVELECITPYLARITVSDKIDQLENFTVSDASKITDYPPSLTLTHEGEEIKFTILSKDVWRSAKVTQNVMAGLKTLDV